MLHRRVSRWVLLLHIIAFVFRDSRAESSKESKDASNDNIDVESFITSMRNDKNLDLSVDEEYEDLRAELLAYHTALADLTASGRRSLISKPCWEIGGICVKYHLCAEPLRFHPEVPGCKDRERVCCFVWNRYKTRDMRDKGISNLAFPWNTHPEFGGKGLRIVHPIQERGIKKNGKEKTNGGRAQRSHGSLALVIESLK